MPTLSRQKVEKLQNMARHGTPGEQAAAKNLLSKHWAAVPLGSNELFTLPADAVWRLRKMRGQTVTASEELKSRMRQESFARCQAAKEAARAEYSQMLDRKQPPTAATYDYRRPITPYDDEPAMGSPSNIAFILFTAIAVALIFALA